MTLLPSLLILFSHDEIHSIVHLGPYGLHPGGTAFVRHLGNVMLVNK